MACTNRNIPPPSISPDPTRNCLVTSRCPGFDDRITYIFLRKRRHAFTVLDGLHSDPGAISDQRCAIARECTPLWPEYSRCSGRDGSERQLLSVIRRGEWARHGQRAGLRRPHLSKRLSRRQCPGLWWQPHAHQQRRYWRARVHLWRASAPGPQFTQPPAYCAASHHLSAPDFSVLIFSVSIWSAILCVEASF